MPTTATQQYNKAIFTLTSALGAHLPPPPATLPPATITLVRADERSVGIGRRTGMERRGDLGPIDVHG
ncbi:MAG: hypothetical protein JO180_11780, partial [Gemmatirosa sp.]|nr:hypothetical protein [Gemmatirosa sp.]